MQEVGEEEKQDAVLAPEKDGEAPKEKSEDDKVPETHNDEEEDDKRCIST